MPTQDEQDPVTVLGLGPMGSALAQAFVAGGHRTTVWNRTKARAGPLVAEGAALAPSPADAVVASPLTVVCVLDYDAVRAIIEPAAAALRGRTLVNVTADTPDRARAMAAWAAECGIAYVDGAIMTPADTIGGPEAVFLFSGRSDAYESQRATLSSLGGTATFLGKEPGLAAAYDIGLLDVFWTAMSGVAHAYALTRAEGVQAADLAPFAQRILELAGRVVADLARDVDRGQYPGDDSAITSNVATMDHIIHVARTRGIDTELMEAAKAPADRVIEAGHGKDGFARVVEALSKQ